MSLPNNMMKKVSLFVPAEGATVPKAVAALRRKGWSPEDGPITQQAVFELLSDLVYQMNASIVTVSGYETETEEERLFGTDAKWREAEHILWTAVSKALAQYARR